MGYERIYQEFVIEGNHDEARRNAVQKAMLQAYVDLNREIQDSRKIEQKIQMQQLRKFMKAFSGTRDESGLIFTTNQDIFTETVSWNGHDAVHHMVWVPGLEEYPYGKGDNVCIPGTESELAEILERRNPNDESHLALIKLHGSWGWRQGTDPNHYMVIGINKEELIKRQPLLNWYYELFRRALTRLRVRLFVIGYGFHDVHINKIIRSSVKNHGLSLYVVDPKPADRLYNDIVHPKGQSITQQDLKDVWEGVHGYFPCSLQRLFPPKNDLRVPSSAARDLDRIFPFFKDFSH